MQPTVDRQTASLWWLADCRAGALCISVVSLDDAVINITGQRNRPRIVSLSAQRGVSGGWERGWRVERRQRRSVARISATDNAKQSWQRDNATRALVVGRTIDIALGQSDRPDPDDDHVQRGSGHAGSQGLTRAARARCLSVGAWWPIKRWSIERCAVVARQATTTTSTTDGRTDSSDRRTDRLTDHRHRCTAATSLTNQSLSSTRCSRWQVVVAKIRVYRPFVFQLLTQSLRPSASEPIS